MVFSRQLGQNLLRGGTSSAAPQDPLHAAVLLHSAPLFHSFLQHNLLACAYPPSRSVFTLASRLLPLIFLGFAPYRLLLLLSLIIPPAALSLGVCSSSSSLPPPPPPPLPTLLTIQCVALVKGSSRIFFDSSSLIFLGPADTIYLFS